MATRKMTEKKRQAPVPDKPTGIAPGAVDVPGKGAPAKNSRGDAPMHTSDVRPERGRDKAGKTGPKGANMKGATQS